MTKRIILKPICVLMILVLLTGCAAQNTGDTALTDVAPTAKAVPRAALPDVNDIALTEDVHVYDDDDPDSLVTFYMTVRRGRDADGTNHSLDEVNSVIRLQEMENVETVMAEILLQEGDENGPLPGALGYGASESNGTIRIRGRTSTLAPQKSYRLDLLDNGELWRGQKAIALLKHPNDPTRLRNKLYFDLLKDVPDTTSLRTQFVHLYVKDETAALPSEEFVDYGLFTFIETPNKRFLRNHGLSREGNLYKANMFEFFRYEDTLRLATDPKYDLSKFELTIESKNGEDHSKLFEMLDALNDYSIPIEEVVEKYFNVDNLMSFVAFNTLMDNQDFNSQNFLLYSPVNSDTWYVILWDGDGSLHETADDMRGEESLLQWQRGISNVWGMVLFNRMFRVEAYREKLAERIELLRDIITPERIAEMIAQYRTVTDVFTQRMPDIINLPFTLAQMEELYESMPYDVDKAYQYFLDTMKKPMPFYMDDVTKTENGLYLSWEEAYDFAGEIVYYDVQVATDWTFEEIVFGQNNLLSLDAELPMLPPGEYWWRVQAHNTSGETQIAFDSTVTITQQHEGMRTFRVTEDGRVEGIA